MNGELRCSTMVSYLELFLEFLKIGFIMFGGGYGGIGIYYRVLVEEKKWISEEEFLSIIGIAESTPGPIAINAATWVGYVLKGIPGSILATLGIVLPCYIVILGIVMSLRPYMDHWIAKAVFRGINAAVLAIILYALIRLANSTLVKSGVVDFVATSMFIIFAILMLTLKLHPIVVIGSAALISLLIKLIGF
ncbi:MAG: chromate transporter [Desulfurococcaceae archaeon]